MQLPSAIQLALKFDTTRLQGDLQYVQANDWIQHYRTSHYQGDWGIVPLRAVHGHPSCIHSVPNSSEQDMYAATPILERCPYYQEVLSYFQCRLSSVRLMRLAAGASILEHTDDMGEDERAELRIHIPVQTNPAIDFFINHQRIPMQVGEMWFGDFRLPHSVDNKSTEDRIHLVVDCVVNEWLLEQVRQAEYMQQSLDFLQQIGIETIFSKIDDTTFLPGLKIVHGKLHIDMQQLQYPGDILHEAGHIAITAPEKRMLLHGDTTTNNPQADGDEMLAVLWSYAAAKHLGLPTNFVFHEHGYKRDSAWLIQQFEEARNYIGIHLLEWTGMCTTKKDAPNAFPKMLRWLR